MTLSMLSLLFFGCFLGITRGETAKWFADFQLKVNLTQMLELQNQESADETQPPFQIGDIRPLVKEIARAQLQGGPPLLFGGNIQAKTDDPLAVSGLLSQIDRLDADLMAKLHPIDVNAAEFQEDIRTYYMNTNGQPPLQMAFFLASLPFMMQNHLVNEAPMMMAAAYLLVAEQILFAGPGRKYDGVKGFDAAVHKYEVVRSITNENPDHVEAWGLHMGLKRFEAAARLSRTSKQIIDVVIVRCKEVLDWVGSTFMLKDWEFVSKMRIYVYNKCGARKEKEEQKSVKGQHEGRFEFIYHDLRNYAMESIGYATHMSLFDDQKSDVLFFLQGDPFHHQVPHLLDVAVGMIQEGLFLASGIPFLHLSGRRFLGSAHECVQELLAKMGFEDVKWHSGYCCNQFIVPRESVFQKETDGEIVLKGDHARHYVQEGITPDGSIVLNPDTIGNRMGSWHYEQARKILNQEIPVRCTQDTSYDDRPGIHTSALYEHMWHVLFKQPGYLPMRKNDWSLPAFMRTEGTHPIFGNLVLKALTEGSAVKSVFGLS